MKKVYKAISQIVLILNPKDGPELETVSDVVTVIDGVEVDQLTAEEQQSLIDSQEATILNSVSQDDVENISTTIEAGSIKLISIVKFVKSEASRLADILTLQVLSPDFKTSLAEQINTRMTDLSIDILQKLTDVNSYTTTSVKSLRTTGCS